MGRDSRPSSQKGSRLLSLKVAEEGKDVEEATGPGREVMISQIHIQDYFK